MNLDDALLYNEQSYRESGDTQEPIWTVFIDGKLICDGREKETVEKVFETLVVEYEKSGRNFLIEFGFLFDRDFSAKEPYKLLEVERYHNSEI